MPNNTHVPKNSTDTPTSLKDAVLTISSTLGEAYLVGGAVRDLIIGRETKDLDFSTPVSPHEVKNLISTNLSLATHDEGIKYGTVSTQLNDFNIQITSFRKEKYLSGSRQPLVSASPDIQSDLARRDFTINSIALSLESLIDPYGGVQDIKRRVIRCTKDVDTKLKEDPLRILRAFRFVSELGFNIDGELLESARKYRRNLDIVSSERVGLEIRKIIGGDYWDDAINELAESGVLNTALRRLDLTYGVSAEDVHYEFSKYTAEQLRNMPIPVRWLSVISIINHGKEKAGVESVDIHTLSEKMLIGAQISKKDRAPILELIKGKEDNERAQKPSSHTAIADDSNIYLRQGTAQKLANDPRWMINLASYHTIEGKEALRSNNYTKSVDHLKQALDISLENIQYIINRYPDKDERASKLRGLNKYIHDRIRYFVLANIFASKLYLKFNNSEHLIKYALKEYSLARSGVSAADLRTTVEHVVASVYKHNPSGITLEPYMDFLNRDDLSMDPESIARYKKSYIENQIRFSNLPPIEKATLYHEKAQLSLVGSDDSQLGFEYYDPLIDYFFNIMISQQKLDDFNKYYDKFAEVANDYLQLSHRWRRLYAGRRSMYLTSASAIVHAIQLSNSLSERRKLSLRVVEDFTEGKDFRSARRYQIYVDWFELVNDIFKSKPKIDDQILLLDKVSNLSSIDYVDEDEAFLCQHRPDLVSKRDLIKDVRVYLSSVVDQKRYNSTEEHIIKDPVIESLRILINNDSIDSSNAFAIFKNHIARIEKEIGRVDTIADIPDKLLAQHNDNVMIEQLLTGESETLEYKSTWQFDLTPYQLSKGKVKQNDIELKREVVKNIVGMSNKLGGTILVGVEDDGNICGLESGDFLMQSSKDHLKKLDNILLDIRNEVVACVGKDVLARLSINPLKYSHGDTTKTIIKIDIPKSVNGPIIYSNEGRESYFVRSSTSTTDAGLVAFGEAFRSFQSR